MWIDGDRPQPAGLVALILGAALAVPPLGAAMSRTRAGEPAPPVVAPALDPRLAGEKLDPRWPKHVFVVTDSVMLGAKQSFIRSLPDWQVTFTGRPALMIRKGLDEYVRQQRSTGPVAVVALGYNTLWERDRKNFKRWSDLFDKSVEEMLAALKERGARKIVWVMLRELTPDMITTGGVSLSQYRKYAWYFPYVNERLHAIKERHPEMALADWATAARRPGVTYDAIHLNPRGSDLMSEVVKVAMGVETQTQPSRVETQPQPSRAEIQTRPSGAEARTPLSTQRVERQQPMPAALRPAGPRIIEIEVPRIAAAQTATPERKRVAALPVAAPSKRRSRGGFREVTLNESDTTSIVMLGDGLTERAQWTEITGCRFIANRGHDADDSAAILRRLDEIVKLRPQTVFLMVGTNDAASNLPAEKTTENVRQIIERLRRAGAVVYLTLVPPVTQSFPQRINSQVNILNSSYIKLAVEADVPLVNFRDEVRTESGYLRDELSADGMHLSAGGYRIWRDAIMPMIERHCPVVDTEVASNQPVSRTAAASQVTSSIPASAPASRTEPASQAASTIPAPAPVDRTEGTSQASNTSAPAPTSRTEATPQAGGTFARGGWIIQVGAFPEQEKANERLREAQSLGKTVLANANPFTEKVVKGRQELYRARFAGFDQSSAAAACSYFKRKEIDCITMKN